MTRVRRSTRTLAVLACAGLTACGGGASKPSTTTSSTPPTTEREPTLAASDKQQITTAWETFFDSSKPADGKTVLLQDGEGLQTVLAAQAAQATTAGSISAKVNGVAGVTASTCSTVVGLSPCAQVTYDLSQGGRVVLASASGYAVQQGGAWKVSKATICTLVGLRGGGRPVPECA